VKSQIEEYLRLELQKLSQIENNTPPQNTEQEIYRLLKTRRFRKYFASESLLEQIQAAIIYKVGKNEPINITILQGCYKLWRLKEAPGPDWAELFALMYYAEWVKPILSFYKPGVIIDFYVDDLIMERISNYERDEILFYQNSFLSVMDFVMTYCPENLRFKLTTVIGIVYFWQGKHDTALEWAEKSLDYMQKSNRKLNIMLANRLFALISMNRGDKNAPDKFIEVLKVLRDNRDINQESVALFADWIVLGEKGYLVGEVSLLQETGICYYRQKKFVDAKKSLLDSKKLAIEINDEEGLAVTLSHLGHVYYGLKDYRSAKKCYLQGLQLAEKVNRKSSIARCCEGLTKIYNKRNRRRKTEKYGLTALDLFDKLNMTTERDDISSILNYRNIKALSGINYLNKNMSMKVIKKLNESFVREDAHNGSGGRKLLLDDNEMKNVQGMTYGFLPAGKKFAWHNHNDLNEVMYVLKGQGTVRDEDGVYPYNIGDVFVFQEGVYHEIENLSSEEHEYIFVRVYNKD